MNMNEVIICDVNLLCNVEKFLKEFANMLITFLINFFLIMIKLIVELNLKSIFKI